MKRLISLALCFMMMLMLTLCQPAFAEGDTITWIGGVDNSWHTAGNWNPAQVPGSGDTAVIPESGTVKVFEDTTVTLDCSGKVQVEAGAHLRLTGNSYLRGEGELIGDGDITITGDDSELQWSGGLIDGNGLLTLEENTSLVINDLSGEDYPNVSLGRSMVNDGQITVYDGELYLYGGAEGVGTFMVSAGAYLSFEEGEYDIGGNFVNCGGVSIWGEASVHFSAGYRQEDTGSLLLRIWGTGTSEYCKLNVTGVAYLGGILEIDFLSGYNPQEGDSFEIVTCSSRIGEFSYLINNVEIDGISMVATYTGRGLTLTVSESEFAGGNGTKDDPYLVANAYHLNNVRKYLNAHFLQISNIDLISYSFVDYDDGIGWEPIGTANAPFNGTFDGGGHTINNLYIERYDYYTGLFGYISYNGKVSNVKLESVDVTSYYDHVGGLAGLSKGLIDNCIVTGRVLTYGWRYPVGGLVGENLGIITCCSFDGLVSGGDDYCGGLVGMDQGTIIGCHTKGTVKGDSMIGGLVGYKVKDSGDIKDSYSECNVEGSGYDIGGLVGNNDGRLEGCFAIGNVKGNTYVGGLVGYNYKPGGIIINCYALGSVEGNDYIGGLAGGNSNSITYCYSAGKVTDNTDEENAGGLVGTATENGSVVDSYWDSGTSSQGSSAGGEGRSAVAMKQRETYEEWDFDTIWNINASYNNGYPFLRWQISVATVPTAPQDFTATPGDGQVTLSWTVPAHDGGADITRYEVSSDDGASWTDVGLNTSYTFTGLSNGTEYTFKVRAVNSAGPGETAITTATPTAAPVTKYTVTVTNGTGSGQYAEGVTVTISVYSAPDGYQFKEWQVITGDVKLEEPKAPSTSFVMPANDVEITAVYEEIPVTTYTVTVNGSYAAETGAGSYAQGDTVTINSGSRTNYSFSGWTSPDGVTFANPNSATTTFIMPAKNVTVTANWTYTDPDDGGDDEDIDEGDDEDGDDTGDSGDSAPSAPKSTPPPTYNANVKTEAGTEMTVPVTVDKDAGMASVDMDSDKLAQGGVNITIPPIPDVNAYSVSIPVQDLSTVDARDAFSFDTETGSITVPSNMLKGITVPEGDKAQITISRGDKSVLPEDIRDAIGGRPLVQLTLTIDGNQTYWSNPDAPVTVSITYTPTAEELENPESIVVWYIDGNGNAVCVTNGRYDPATETVTFTTSHFSYYAVSYKQMSFRDVPKDAWYAKAVSFIAARDITQGTGGGNFSPEAKLTRAQFIVMMMRAYGIAPDTDADSADNFADAGETWYTGYLAAAKRLKITAGVGNNMFAPDRDITRQEMFTLLYNTLRTVGQLPGLHGQVANEADDQPTSNSGKTLTDFSDAGDIAPWARVAMKRLVEAGIISGSGNRLSPKDIATRAQMAQVLYNLLSK